MSRAQLDPAPDYALVLHAIQHASSAIHQFPSSQGTLIATQAVHGVGSERILRTL